MTKDELISFEAEVERQFSDGNIRGPIHLCGGNEDQLIDIFKQIKRTDWVFSTWRHDYHALLHGIPPETLMAEIMAGRGMNFSSVEHRFFTSAIVGGILPIATGVAHAIKMNGGAEKVFCFVGDMAARTGMAKECREYRDIHELPMLIVEEKNSMSAETPLSEFGRMWSYTDMWYVYTPTKPHAGVGRWVDIK